MNSVVILFSVFIPRKPTPVLSLMSVTMMAKRGPIRPILGFGILGA